MIAYKLNVSVVEVSYPNENVMREGNAKTKKKKTIVLSRFLKKSKFLKSWNINSVKFCVYIFLFMFFCGVHVHVSTWVFFCVASQNWVTKNYFHNRVVSDKFRPKTVFVSLCLVSVFSFVIVCLWLNMKLQYNFSLYETSTAKYGSRIKWTTTFVRRGIIFSEAKNPKVET